MIKLKQILSLILINWLILCSITPSFAQSIAHQKIYINKDALYYAHKAYNKLKAEHRVSSPIIAIVDFSLPSSQRRFFVLNIETDQVLYREFVAHGSGSGMGDYATSFSNEEGSDQSSLGVYLTGQTYYGHAGLSRKVIGLEPGFNDNAYARHVVIHGAKYVGQNVVNSRGILGHSWGCFALDYGVSSKIIQTLTPNSMIFAYANNSNYINNSRFLN